MVIQARIHRSEYHDSVTLMLAARAVLDLPGVEDAAVVMGTPANRDILASADLLAPEVAAAGADDLVIVVRAADGETAASALAEAEEMLRRVRPDTRPPEAARPRSLATAMAAHPEANLVVISVAGRYAAEEARAALEGGRHVVIFSDNVPLEQEIALKRYALERGLLCMGPDAGTAIINGVALGFGNAVPRGNVGLVSASGTGLQAVTCSLARAGAGVSQAIGVGSRDLTDGVGGLMMAAGLQALQADPGTDVIVLISKPPADRAAERVLSLIAHSPKPTVVCFLGAEPEAIERAGGLAASNLTQAAALAAALATGHDPGAALNALEAASVNLIPLAAAEQSRLAPGQHALRGLYAGGTLCYETQCILQGLPEPVLSNVPLRPANRLPDGHRSAGHTCIDMGADEFTQGRLHPMLDPTLRNRRIVQEARDPETAVILLDVVLGYGAHPDPAGAAAEAIREARRIAADAGRHLVVVASVCGTEADPQCLSRQEAKLCEADATVLPDNASAARLAGLITQALHE